MKDISLYYLFHEKDIFLGPEMFKCVPLLCFMWLYNFLDFITKVALHHYKITTNIEKRSSSASAIHTRQKQNSKSRYWLREVTSDGEEDTNLHQREGVSPPLKESHS
jgi:hypothetical protein